MNQFLLQSSAIINPRDLQLIVPELILTVAACVALVMEVILPYKRGKWTAYFCLGGIALALISLGAQFVQLGGTFRLASLQNLSHLDGFYQMVRIDGFSFLFRVIFLNVVTLAISISICYFAI